MKLINECSVYLISKQVVTGRDMQLASFLKDHEIEGYDLEKVDSQAIPEIAGRLCYMSFTAPRPGGNRTYLENILKQAHGSVLEHTVWGFIFTGISRTCSHELVRHRAGFGYSQLSQRYVDESVAEYVVPLELQKDVAEQTVIGRVWLGTIEAAHASYITLVDKLLGKITQLYGPEQMNVISPTNKTELRKRVRQAARSVLPNCTETKLFVTGNARSWRHFIEMRASRHAEPEIRRLAVKVLQTLQQEAPHLFGDYTLESLPDGTFEATTLHKKV